MKKQFIATTLFFLALGVITMAYAPLNENVASSIATDTAEPLS